MRWPIRNQIFLPFAGLLLFAVLLVAFVASWEAGRQSRDQKLKHIRLVAKALGSANFPFTPDIAERIAAMIDGDVIAADPSGKVVTSTLQLRQLPEPLRRYAESTVVISDSARIGDYDYIFTVVPRIRVQRPGPVFVLMRQEDLTTLWIQAIIPPLVVAIPTLLLTLGLALVISRRISNRVNRLSNLFGDLTDGHYRSMEESGRDDELRDLVRSANALSSTLETYQAEMQRTERLGLLSQLSGGLAHQLRNSITGARMAIQLFQESYSAGCDQPNDTSNEKSGTLLQTAILQLKLTEEQVMAVLSLRAKSQPVERTSVDLCAMIEEVIALLRPQCLHWKSRLEREFSYQPMYVALRHPASIKGAILNVTLNALEAAGTYGHVLLHLEVEGGNIRIVAKDNGDGFAIDSEQLAEVFRTTKSEGIGIGLTIAQHAVNEEHGEIKFMRVDGWTLVVIEIPIDSNGPTSNNGN